MQKILARGDDGLRSSLRHSDSIDWAITCNKLHFEAESWSYQVCCCQGWKHVQIWFCEEETPKS